MRANRHPAECGAQRHIIHPLCHFVFLPKHKPPKADRFVFRRGELKEWG